MGLTQTYVVVEGAYGRIEEGRPKRYGRGEKVELTEREAASLGKKVKKFEPVNVKAETVTPAPPKLPEGKTEKPSKEKAQGA